MKDPRQLAEGAMLLLYIAAVVLGLTAIFSSRLAPVRTVKAQVVEKFKDQVFSKSQGLKQTRFSRLYR